MYYKILQLRKNIDPTDFQLQDDGNGPYISKWTSSEPKPTDEELASVDDAKPSWIVAQEEIQRLEGQVTQRRLREAYADSTWLDAQEALIATERAKLKE
jgi:hypothetical protein